VTACVCVCVCDRQDKNDGSLETRLYIGRALEHNFRWYSVVAENRIGVATARVQLTYGTSLMTSLTLVTHRQTYGNTAHWPTFLTFFLGFIAQKAFK